MAMRLETMFVEIAVTLPEAKSQLIKFFGGLKI